jgi:hypothetical protein
MVLKRKRDAGLGEVVGWECLGGGAMAARLVDGYFLEVIAKEEGVMRKHDKWRALAGDSNTSNELAFEMFDIYWP